MNVGDFLVERLAQWGVERIYGYPGDGINGIMGALERAEDRIEFIQVRHEEMAAFMACGHAKFTGEVGVCLATSGPGAIHLLNGLYDAKLDHQPVVAIVGQQARAALGGHYQQEVDLVSLFKDVAHEYVHMVSDPAQVRHLIDRALRIALAERTVTCVIVPNDVQTMDAVPEPEHAHGTIHSSVGYSRPRVVPSDEDLERAAEVLNAGERVAILAGQGALHATDELSVADWWRVVEERAMNEADPINPQRVFWELSPRLPDNCILTSDSGSAANWFARDLKIRRGMLASLSGNLATMGSGVPYAIAAKFAHPERPVIALVGDGAMQMNGINELITIAKYHHRWSDQRLIVLVLNNRDLNQVTWEQRAMSGDPKFEGSQDLPDFPYASYAELIGLKGIRVDSPEQVGSAWDEALNADRPVVYEAI